MKYERRIILKDGRVALLRNGGAEDGQAVLDVFLRTHAETDNLLTYPDECGFDAEQEAQYLAAKAESPNEIEIVAFVDGRVAGTAGIDAVGNRRKLRHRADFGIGLLKEYWGLGLGRALTEACIECAAKAGYAQLELNVVVENERAIALYRSLGFEEFGRNPMGFDSPFSGFQELVYMRLVL